jgi:Uncharacterised nucleotidyltransferase
VSGTAQALRASPALERVTGLLDEMDEAAARAHGLGPLAARRWRERGRAVPSDFARMERAATISRRLAKTVLEQAASAYDGPLLVFKGPEIAELYPPGTRFFSDLDVLTDDAPAAQSALLAAGFVEVDDPEGVYAEIHHLNPIHLPGIPLNLEIHSRPKWPSVLPRPDVAEIVEAAVPSRTSVAGLLAPAPAHHALIVVGHAWAHMPLRAIRTLLDAELVAAEAEAEELERVAARWGVERLWHTDAAVRAWLFADGPEPLAVRVWGRHLRAAREPTVIASHVERWLAPFWLLPPGAATRASARAIARDVAPQGGESWGAKARRVARAARNAFKTHSEHGWDPREGPAPRRSDADRPAS